MKMAGNRVPDGLAPHPAHILRRDYNHVHQPVRRSPGHAVGAVCGVCSQPSSARSRGGVRTRSGTG